MVRTLRNVIGLFSTHIASILPNGRRDASRSQTTQSNRVIGALLDAGTSTLLTVTNRPSVLRALNELVPGTVYLRTVYYARTPATRAILDGKASAFPEWQWSQETASFFPAHQAPSDELRQRAALAHAKRDALTLLIERVNGLRLRPATALEDQAMVYLEKRDQARAFKETGYEATKLHLFPYVEQYAAIAKRSPRQAADEILFQARLRDDVLQKSEAVRLRFQTMIRDAKSVADLAHFTSELDSLTMQVLK